MDALDEFFSKRKAGTSPAPAPAKPAPAPVPAPAAKADPLDAFFASRKAPAATPTTAPAPQPRPTGILATPTSTQVLAPAAPIARQPSATTSQVKTVPKVYATPQTPQQGIAVIADKMKQTGKGGILPKQPVFEIKVGEGLSNVTDVKPGPYQSTLDRVNRAKENGEILNYTQAPTQTSQVTRAKEAAGINPSKNAPVEKYDDIQKIGIKAQDYYDLYAESAPIKVAKKAVGQAVGAFGAAIGAGVGAVASANEMRYGDFDKKKFLRDVVDSARATSEFGYDIGSEAAVQAPIANAGKLVNVLTAIPQVTQVYSDVKEGNLTPEAGVNAALAAVSLFGAFHEKGVLPGSLEDAGMNWYNKRITTNDIVKSAADMLGVPVKKGVLGKVNKVDEATVRNAYRAKAGTTHPDKGGNSADFQSIVTARDVMLDYNTLSPTDFRNKYEKPLTQLQEVIKQLPEKATPPAAPKPVAEAVPETPAGKPKPTFEPYSEKVVAEAPAVAEPAAPAAASSLFEQVRREQQAAIKAAVETASEFKENGAYQAALARGKAEGMELAAVKRGLEGKPTTAEFNKAQAFLDSNYAGKDILVDGLPAKATGQTSFGNPQYELPDGTKAYALPGQITVPEGARTPLEYIREQAEAKLQAYADIYNVKPGEVANPVAVPESAVIEAPVAPELPAQPPVAKQVAVPKAKAVPVEASAKGAVPKARAIPEPKKSVLPKKTAVKTAVEPLPKKTGDVPEFEPIPGKSKVGRSIEARAIENKLANSFSDTAGYDPITIKDQAERAAKLINEDMDAVRRIIAGEQKVPEGLKPEALLVAVEEHATKTGDPQLALDLANSQLASDTSMHAQALRLLAERAKDSVVNVIKQVKKIKSERFARAAERIVDDIESSVRKTVRLGTAKQPKQAWADFVDSITCK